MAIEVIGNVFCLLSVLYTASTIKSIHVVNHLNAITELMKENVDMEQTDVVTILSKLREIEAQVKLSANVSDEAQKNEVGTDTQSYDRGTNIMMDIIQKAFKAEKEMNTRIRRDQLAMEEKLFYLESKADKCELTSAFTVVQTSLQLMSTSQQTRQNSITSYLVELQNRTRQIEQSLLMSVSFGKRISDIVEACIGSDNSSNQAKEIRGDVEVKTEPRFMSCNDVDSGESGVYTVYPKFEPSGIQVYCDMKTDGGGWIVLQRRKDGYTDFYRDWKEYKNGFGDLSWEFWLGNDNLHGFTFEHPTELRIDLIDENGKRGYAKYKLIKVSSEKELYTLFTDGYSGSIGDSLTYHNNMKFSTKDKDQSGNNCATSFHGAWWYRSCHFSNLNGNYFVSGSSGVGWYHWHNTHDTVMKFSEIKMRWKV